MFLLAQRWASWSIAEIAIALVIIIAVVALVHLYCKWAGVVIPAIAYQVAWIVLGAIVVIFAIRFLFLA